LDKRSVWDTELRMYITGNSYNALKDGQGKVKYDVAYLWEFNPQLVRAYLRPLEAVDPIVKVVPRPAWGKDENMTFFIDKRCVSRLRV